MNKKIWVIILTVIFILILIMLNMFLNNQNTHLAFRYTAFLTKMQDAYVLSNQLCAVHSWSDYITISSIFLIFYV